MLSGPVQIDESRLEKVCQDQGMAVLKSSHGQRGSKQRGANKSRDRGWYFMTGNRAPRHCIVKKSSYANIAYYSA